MKDFSDPAARELERLQEQTRKVLGRDFTDLVRDQERPWERFGISRAQWEAAIGKMPSEYESDLLKTSRLIMNSDALRMQNLALTLRDVQSDADFWRRAGIDPSDAGMYVGIARGDTARTELTRAIEDFPTEFTAATAPQEKPDAAAVPSPAPEAPAVQTPAETPASDDASLPAVLLRAISTIEGLQRIIADEHAKRTRAEDRQRIANWLAFGAFVVAILALFFPRTPS